MGLASYWPAPAVLDDAFAWTQSHAPNSLARTIARAAIENPDLSISGIRNRSTEREFWPECSESELDEAHLAERALIIDGDYDFEEQVAFAAAYLREHPFEGDPSCAFASSVQFAMNRDHTGWWTPSPAGPPPHITLGAVIMAGISLGYVPTSDDYNVVGEAFFGELVGEEFRVPRAERLPPERIVPAAGAAEGPQHDPRPVWLEQTRDGFFPATISNLSYALDAPRWTGVDIGFDEFLGETMFCRAGSDQWQVLGDDDRAELRLSLERIGFKAIKREDLRDAVRIIARKNRFDSAQQWLRGLRWDGQPRVETFLIDHFGTEDTPYARAVGRYWWSAQAARILHPGCQVDMVPVLVSPEGRYKSTTLQALVPSIDHFTEIDLAVRDADLSRQLRGKLLGELGELKGLNKRETADLKAKITSRFEEWTPKYVEGTVRFQRRLVFVGTTNDDQFMGPAIGKRRWLPVSVTTADPIKLAAVRDQLWAEGAEIVKQRVAEGLRGEVEWEGAYGLAPAEREHFETEDPWTTGVDHWIENSDPKPEEFTTDVAFCAIFSAFDRIARNPTPNEQSRMAEILKSRGFKQARKCVNGRKRRVWTTAGPLPEAVSGHS